MKSQKRLNIIYSLLAGLPYDLMNRAVYNFMEPRRDLFEQLDIPEGANLIEICAGTGLNLKYYPKSAKGCVSDMNTRMLKSAEKKARAYDLTELDFRVLDATRLPFKDDSFDVGIVTYGLAAIPDHVKALSELRRVVSPGGRIGLIEFDTEESALSGTVKIDMDDLIRNAGMKIVYRKESPQYRLPIHKQIQTEYILTV
jgi:ubiquinone/menaquinone biosynthesis C-methylase UbiE